MSDLDCLITQGDSISGCSDCYPYQALGLTSRGDCTTSVRQAQAQYVTSEGLIFCNMAVAGTRLGVGTGTDNMTSVAEAYIDPWLARRSLGPTVKNGIALPPTREYILSFHPGSNDGCLRNGTVQAFVDAVVAHVAARKAAGIKRALLVTPLPRNDSGGPMIDANRLAYISIVEADGWAAAHGIDRVCNLGRHPIMGDIAACSDPELYEEHEIHPLAAGHALLAPVWKADIDALRATL